MYRGMRVEAAQREPARNKGTRFLPPGYSYVNHQTWTRRFSGTTVPVGAYVWYKGQDNLWWRGINSAHTPRNGQYVVRLLDDTDRSSSRSLLLGTLRLLAPLPAPGVYSCITGARSCVVLYGTSTNLAHLK